MRCYDELVEKYGTSVSSGLHCFSEAAAEVDRLRERLRVSCHENDTICPTAVKYFEQESTLSALRRELEAVKADKERACKLLVRAAYWVPYSAVDREDALTRPVDECRTFTLIHKFVAEHAVAAKANQGGAKTQ